MRYSVIVLVSNRVEYERGYANLEKAKKKAIELYKKGKGIMEYVNVDAYTKTSAKRACVMVDDYREYDSGASNTIGTVFKKVIKIRR